MSYKLSCARLLSPLILPSQPDYPELTNRRARTKQTPVDVAASVTCRMPGIYDVSSSNFQVLRNRWCVALRDLHVNENHDN